MGRRDGVDILADGKTSCPCRNTNPRSSIPQPTHNNDYSLPAPNKLQINKVNKPKKYRISNNHGTVSSALRYTRVLVRPRVIENPVINKLGLMKEA